MKFIFRPITKEDALIIAQWEDYRPGDFIYMEPYLKSHEKNENPLIGPGGCIGYTVYNESELFGLFEFIRKSEYLEIGMAINPKFRGKGHGKLFLKAGIAFGKKMFPNNSEMIQLCVSEDNLNAIKLYEANGFKRISSSLDEKTNQITLLYQLAL
ncbi:MAG: GNAT family N-acetyltransferase [Bacteroidia bacterium]